MALHEGAELGTLSGYLCFSNKSQGRRHRTGATGLDTDPGYTCRHKDKSPGL